MTSTSMPTTAARQRLHDAALQVFAQRGSSEVTVSELAQVAGIARGTVYNNIDSPDDLFHQVAIDLSREMHTRMRASFATVGDPAERLANALRFCIRRAHDEPDWGRFVARFGLSNASLQQLWSTAPVDDVVRGIDQGRYTITRDLLPGVQSMLTGTTITGMWLVLEGHQTWREGGSTAAELVLRALGIDPGEAHRLATMPLPDLPPVAEAPAATDPDLHDRHPTAPTPRPTATPTLGDPDPGDRP
ncbi:TetR/AcrR family transcriptional regulator [Salsipaludibacter albus]|uniref:TetR/AcrR family transcriptional regulator n=1 Tax=Salsipaludibacter albus TaxID=2849650 RepID=UPI001EE467BA